MNLQEKSFTKKEAALYLNLTVSAFDHHVRRSGRIPPAAIVGEFGRKEWTQDQLDQFKNGEPIRTGWHEWEGTANRLTPAQFIKEGWNERIEKGVGRAFHKPDQFRTDEYEIRRIDPADDGRYSTIVYVNGAKAQIWRSGRVRVEQVVPA